MRARLNPLPVPPSLYSERVSPPAVGLTDQVQLLVRCRGCGTKHNLSAVRTLSTHRTSEGVLVYVRCPAGHAGFFTTRR